MTRGERACATFPDAPDAASDPLGGSIVRTASIIAAAVVLLPLAAVATTRTVPAVRISEEVDVSAPPAKVWKSLTEGRNLVTWCPLWKSDANRAANLAKVGDTLVFSDTMGGGGTSIVTYLQPARELRVAHEPADGSYLCRSKVVLTPAKGGTHVAWQEEYTDESSDTDRDATAAKVTGDMQAFLQELRKNAEH